MTPQQAATATLDELRDWCAGDDGWTYEPAQRDGLGALSHYWWRYTIGQAHGGRTYAYAHPHPPTRDGAAKAMPEGWTWKRYTDTDDGEVWAAWKTVGEGIWVDEVNVPDTGDEIADRFRLAVLCRIASKQGGTE